MLHLLESVVTEGTASQLATYYAQINKINNMIADPTTGLTPVLSDFFKGIQEQLLSFAETVKENYRVLYWTDFVCNYISLAMNIVLFLFGNYIYYRHAVKKIKAVRNDNRSLIDVQSRIRMAGGAYGAR